MFASSGIGIIGGADGPTAIYITGNPFPGIIITVLAIAAVIGISVYFIKKHKK